MVSLTKAQKNKLKEILIKSEDKQAKEILEKLNKEKRLEYIHGSKNIRRLLKKAFEEKKKVKIRYYSPHSDEHTTRIIDIYQIYINSIIAFCHLRDEERTFAIERINSVALLDEKYTIPKNWSPESIILDK